MMILDPSPIRRHTHTSSGTNKALRVLVPFVGMLFVIHLAERDWHRFIEEWCLFVQTYHRGSNQLHQLH